MLAKSFPSEVNFNCAYDLDAVRVWTITQRLKDMSKPATHSQSNDNSGFPMSGQVLKVHLIVGIPVNHPQRQSQPDSTFHSSSPIITLTFTFKPHPPHFPLAISHQCGGQGQTQRDMEKKKRKEKKHAEKTTKAMKTVSTALVRSQGSAVPLFRDPNNVNGKAVRNALALHRWVLT